MVAEAIAGLGALKTAFDMAKGLKDINDAAIRNAAVIELQESILAGQQAQAALIEQVGNLEKEVARLETWETEKQRYQLEAIREEVFAYVLKADARPPEPPHKACANCYADKRVSVLQAETRNPGRVNMLVCHHCGSELILDGQRESRPPPKVNLGYSASKRRR